jgi:uncharacterized membrane protein
MVFTSLFMWVHLVAVIAFIGSLIIHFAVYRPAAARLTPRPEQAEFATTFEQRARTLRWLGLVLLLVTGFVHLLYEGGSARIESTYGAVLMLKLFLVLVLFGLTAVHDFVIGPPGPSKVLAQAARGTTPAREPLRRGPPVWLGLLILALGLLIVLIAVILIQL